MAFMGSWLTAPCHLSKRMCATVVCAQSRILFLGNYTYDNLTEKEPKCVDYDYDVVR